MMMSTGYNLIGRGFNGRRAIAAAVSSLALLCMASAGAEADEHEKGEALELEIDQLKQELEQLRGRVDEAEARAPADERVLGPREMQSGSEDVSLTVSGQVNRGFLVTDDGDDTDVFFVDNDNSSTRIRLIGDAKLNDDIKIGSVIEVQFESNSTADVSQNNQRNAGNNNFTERKLEIYADSKSGGRLWLGQGDTASNGSSEVDLSGTSVIGYSSVADFAGGIQFQENGVLSGVTIGDTFNNLDGLSRDDRVRYDTPVLGGAKLSASAIADGRWDAAFRYAREIAGVMEFETAVAYAVVDDGNDFDQISGSASILLNTGLPGANVTFAAGNRDFDDGGQEDARFLYGKLGYLMSAFGIGDTAFALDYYYGEDIDQNGDESASVGALAVQNVDSIGTELYAGYRYYTLDRGGADFDDINGLLVGARVKF